MVKKILAQAYLWILLLLLYSPIVIIVIYSFTEAKVLVRLFMIPDTSSPFNQSSIF